MFCHQNICWRQHFLVKIIQNLFKIGTFSNCYIWATNQRKNKIELNYRPQKTSSIIDLKHQKGMFKNVTENYDILKTSKNTFW